MKRGPRELTPAQTEQLFAPMRRAADHAPSVPESAEQRLLLRWAKLHAGRYPELELLYHVPNGEKRGAITAKMLQAAGVKRGVPDLVLPCARGGHFGLYLELKRAGATEKALRPSQATWRDRLRAEGYRVEMAAGAAAAQAILLDYLHQPRTEVR